MRYKVKFKHYAEDGSLIQAGCHIEEQEDGTFKHIWTRVGVKFDETEDACQDTREIDVVRPGRYCLTCTACMHGRGRSILLCSSTKHLTQYIS